MRLGGYSICILLIIQIIGVIGTWTFKSPPNEYSPYILSIMVVWTAFGFISGCEPK